MPVVVVVNLYSAENTVQLIQQCLYCATCPTAV